MTGDIHQHTYCKRSGRSWWQEQIQSRHTMGASQTRDRRAVPPGCRQRRCKWRGEYLGMTEYSPPPETVRRTEPVPHCLWIFSSAARAFMERKDADDSRTKERPHHVHRRAELHGINILSSPSVQRLPNAYLYSTSIRILFSIESASSEVLSHLKSVLG